MFTNRLAITPLKGFNWKLLEPLGYYHEASNTRVTAPIGFVYNGTSIPRIFQNVFQKGGLQLYGSCIHDYCYQTQCVSKWLADRYLYAGMREKGCGRIRSWLFYSAVNTFGWVPWLRHKKRLSEETK